MNSIQSKCKREQQNTGTHMNCNIPINYHPWESQYHQMVIREKSIKPMTKSPYIPRTRIISHAIEHITTETECCSELIPPEFVTVTTSNVQQAPRPPSSPISIYY